MKIGRQLNTLSYSEYLHLLKNYSRYTDFNSLGLFRSILENKKLILEQKIEVRDAAINTFPRFFNFLQVTDPRTFRKLELLGKEFTVADERRTWDIIQLNQQRILNSRRIRHRNFGTYSKHSCGYDTCNLNNLMVKQGSLLTESTMHFPSDKGGSYAAWDKARARKRNRKQQKQVIEREFEASSTADIS